MSAALIILLVAVVMLVVAVVGTGLRKRQEADEGDIQWNRIGDRLRRLQANMEKYKVMTPALLEETPDDKLIEAVLSNLWAKMAPDMSDASAVMAGQNTERQHLFALYSITGGIGQDGVAATKQGSDGHWGPMAVQALEEMGMPQSATLLHEGLSVDGEEADSFQGPYLETFDGEGGKERMVAYIRTHAKDFSDLT